MMLVYEIDFFVVFAVRPYFVLFCLLFAVGVGLY